MIYEKYYHFVYIYIYMFGLSNFLNVNSWQNSLYDLSNVSRGNNWQFKIISCQNMIICIELKRDDFIENIMN